MEDKIREQIRIAKIKNFKNPVVLMHETDFENLKTYVESKVVNLKIGDHPKFEGIPIRISNILKKGNFYIYDDCLYNWL